MPDVSFEAPARGDYEFVLANFKFDPEGPHFEAISSEHATSRAIEWPFGIAPPVEKRDDLPFYPTKRGDRVSMMFVRSRFLRDRIWRLGWVDVTDAWNDGLALADEATRATAPKIPPLATGKKVTSSGPAPSRARGGKSTTPSP